MPPETLNVSVCVHLYKAAKWQMRQLRKGHNRNVANATGEPTIVSHLFEGQLTYTTLCMHCSYQAESTQTFTVLSLAIPSDVIKCSIQVPLNTYRSSHSLMLKLQNKNLLHLK